MRWRKPEKTIYKAWVTVDAKRCEMRIRWYVRNNARIMNGKLDGGCHDNRLNAVEGIEYQ